MAAKNIVNFREKFIPNKEIIQWFPGHMHKGMKIMQQKLKNVDCILEIHDARIPFSGRNPNFYNMLMIIKPHILILNKKDLADISQKKQILEKLKKQDVVDVIFTNCKLQSDPGIKEILPKCLNLIQNSNRYHRSENSEYSLMAIGVPNVGKSSIINVLRNNHLKKANATRVGALPGITRSVLEKIKICENPSIYLFDTPGILTPSIKNIEMGLRLALCATIKDNIVGEDIIADYLLFTLNKQKNYSYVEYLGLKEPCDDINQVLLMTAIHSNITIMRRSTEGKRELRPDFLAAANYFIKGFRKGKFGRILLDEM